MNNIVFEWRSSFSGLGFQSRGLQMDRFKAEQTPPSHHVPVCLLSTSMHLFRLRKVNEKQWWGSRNRFASVAKADFIDGKDLHSCPDEK